VIDAGQPGTTYNVGANAQLSNLDLTRKILEVMGKDDSMISYVADRPGHDLRYAVDSQRIRSLGWRPAHTLEERLASTVEWYRRREDWWRALKAQAQ
jgi:dTDP-glucose 4,6-dehydratase